jgi:hypothetical protein
MLENSPFHIGCPACGGVIDCSSSQKLTQCLHCAARVLLDDEDICPQHYLEPLFDMENATRATAAHLSNPRIDGSFIENFALNSNVRLVYLPVYRLKGVYFTALKGKQKDSTNPISSNICKPESSKPDVSMRITNYYELAVSAKEFGLSTMEISSLFESFPDYRIKSYNREAMGVDAQVFAPDKTVSQLKAIFDSSKAGKETKNNLSKLIQPTPAIFYCPIYIFSTSHNNSLYKTVVNGATGMIIFGRAPESFITSTFLTQSLICILAIGSWLLFHFLQKTSMMGQAPSIGKTIIALFAFIPLIAIYRLWERLWFGRYVECHNNVFFKKEFYKRTDSVIGWALDMYEEGIFFLISLLPIPSIQFEEKR